MAIDVEKCVKCLHNKVGRYTRIASGRSGTWTKASLPAWWCYTCLPLGQGRGEDGQTQGPLSAASSATAESPATGRVQAPKRATRKPSDPFGSKAAAQAASKQPGVRETVEEAQAGTALAPAQKKTQGLVVAQVASLQTEVEELEITDDKSYEYADTLLGRARNATKVWEPVWSRIQDRVIKPQRAALEELYSLNRDIEGPALKIQTAVKAKMKAYKVEEARRIQAEQDARDQAAQLLIEEAQAKEKAIEEAKTPAMRELLRTALEGLNQRAEEKLMETSAAPVMGNSSGTRKVKKVRVGNMENFCLFLLLEDPDSEVSVRIFRTMFLKQLDDILNTRWRMDKNVGSIPGVEEWEDLDIVGRG